VHTALPAFLRVVWLVHALPARGMVRVVGEKTRDSDVSSANLVSQWMVGPVVGRGREPQSEWVGGQGSIPNH
jgi:hypothetical protein